uniref:NADH-ubiquinone oxidoreductase chain 4 n=1 Tax=Caulerpa lentillifera TaxID=148947 RepID=A0A2Z2QKI0_9CHLO|nr:NADH dehydrogenase subunit 4 [Caulerpa lentillifera]AST24243.1 NADH dehydrogenase subunit 4 [Caulerpa lentillifera]QKS32213.1 NADH dehydrogenase subunit 4 [Caulerpa lentillifera]
MSLLLVTLASPLVGAAMVLSLPGWDSHRLRRVALGSCCVSLWLTLALWACFDFAMLRPQFVGMFGGLGRLFSTIGTCFAADGLSLVFMVLTAFTLPVCLLLAWCHHAFVKQYCLSFLILEFLLFAVFCCFDLFVFYSPKSGLLGARALPCSIWGSRIRRIRAAYQFFLFTLFGSLIMLTGILLLFLQTGSLDYSFLTTCAFSEKRQTLLWLLFFTSFAVKVPMVPVHWLPEAHVEAPTAGSVILAGILLKLGAYGFLRFSIPLFPKASLFFSPLVTLCFIAVLYAALTTLRQTDLKKIIAYSSIGHMNVAIVGLFSFDIISVSGSVILLLAHGIVSPALFISIGVLYDRFKTRLCRYYSGSALWMPMFSTMLFLFSLANLSLPSTINFIGEFLVFMGTFDHNPFAAAIIATSLVSVGAYGLLVCARAAFGVPKQAFRTVCDLSRREFFICLPFRCNYFVLWPQAQHDREKTNTY